MIDVFQLFHHGNLVLLNIAFLGDDDIISLFQWFSKGVDDLEGKVALN